MHHAEGRELSTVAQFVWDVPHLLYCGLYQYPQFTSLFPFRVNLGVFACDLINDRFQLVLSMSRRSISASRRRLSLVLLSDSLEVISELSVRAGRLSARVGYVIQANLFCLCCGSLHPGGQGVRACHTSTYLSPSKKKTRCNSAGRLRTAIRIWRDHGAAVPINTPAPNIAPSIHASKHNSRQFIAAVVNYA